MSEIAPPPREHGEASPASPERSTSRWRLWIALAVLVALGSALLLRHRSAAKAGTAKPAPRAVPVTAALARTGDIGVYLEALGTVTPVYTVIINSRVQGQIMRVDYREGQLVHAGDPLVEIDPRPFEAALIQAEGQLAHDRGVLRQARIDLQRFRVAWAGNAIPRQQLEDQEQIVLQSEGSVKMDEGTVANARVNLVYCHITSPIDGRVGLRLVDPGNMVQANSTTSLVTITQIQPITVIFNVSQDFLSQIQAPLRRGERLKVDAFDRTAETLLATGSLLTLDNMVDTTTGTIRLRAIFPNANQELFPNQFVNARLLVNTLRGVTLLPTPAVQRKAQGPFVYLISPDQTAAVRSIKTRVTEGNETAVEGVNAGEVVATSGFDKLQEGVKVKVRAAPPQPEPNSPAPGMDP